VRAAKKQAAALSETKAAPADTPATKQNESNNSGYLILGVGGLIISALGVYYQREVIMASFANRAGITSPTSTKSTQKRTKCGGRLFTPSNQDSKKTHHSTNGLKTFLRLDVTQAAQYCLIHIFYKYI